MWGAIASGLLMAAAPQTNTTALDSLIREHGLEDLTDAQMANVRALLLSALRAAPDDSLTASADAYFRREGFEKCQVTMVDVNGSRWIVVDSGSGPYATSNIPILLDSLNVPSGIYYCKPNLIGGGATEIIDNSGEVQSFLFVTWKKIG